jgi:AraC-like DNA-binding protein
VADSFSHPADGVTVIPFDSASECIALGGHPLATRRIGTLPPARTALLWHGTGRSRLHATAVNGPACLLLDLPDRPIDWILADPAPPRALLFLTTRAWLAAHLPILGVTHPAHCPPHRIRLRALDAEPVTRMLSSLMHPPPVACLTLWWRGRIFDFLAHTRPRARRGRPPAPHRHAHELERARRAEAGLRARLDQPLDLGALARHVGCSPSHLSRTFAATTGMTLAACLRHLRIEEAARLLRATHCSVTEAAYSVGYRSLSAFTRAFVREMGRCPCLYRATHAPSRT